MSQADVTSLFEHSLNTFRAFDNLTVEGCGSDQDAFPTSVWQILNHLITWQAYQLNQLRNIVPERDISEVDTWISERGPQNDSLLHAAVEQFDCQIEAIQTELKSIGNSGQEWMRKLIIIQELSLHLAFHLSEVVLMRRVKGSYPLTHQMKEFLQG